MCDFWFTVRAQSQDITALGVAMAAGQAKGIAVWDMNAENHETVPVDTFLPTTTYEGSYTLLNDTLTF